MDDIGDMVRDVIGDKVGKGSEDDESLTPEEVQRIILEEAFYAPRH